MSQNLYEIFFFFFHALCKLFVTHGFFSRVYFFFLLMLSFCTVLITWFQVVGTYIQHIQHAFHSLLLAVLMLISPAWDEKLPTATLPSILLPSFLAPLLLHFSTLVLFLFFFFSSPCCPHPRPPSSVAFLLSLPPWLLLYFVSGLSSIQDILSLTSTEEEASWSRKQVQRWRTV